MASEAVKRPSDLIQDPNYVSPRVVCEIRRFVHPSFQEAGRLMGDIDSRDSFDGNHLRPAVSLIRQLREDYIPRRVVRDVVRVICARDFKRMPHSQRVTLAELVIGYLGKTGETTP